MFWGMEMFIFLLRVGALMVDGYTPMLAAMLCRGFFTRSTFADSSGLACADDDLLRWKLWRLKGL